MCGGFGLHILYNFKTAQHNIITNTPEDFPGLREISTIQVRKQGRLIMMEPQMDTHYIVYRQIKYFVGELVCAKVKFSQHS